jgi:hypothetical protein
VAVEAGLCHQDPDLPLLVSGALAHCAVGGPPIRKTVL